MGLLSTYSMRGGGAVYPLSCNVDRTIVQTLGRWETAEALQMYVGKYEATMIDKHDTDGTQESPLDKKEWGPKKKKGGS